jgi:Pup amidohydrolase
MGQLARMEIVFGLETEIGISRERAEDIDVVAESISLVRAAAAPGVRFLWDYSSEDPHMDARGFRVSELRQDTDEADYAAQDAARPMSRAEIKSDLLLPNGGRLYNDHAHPEYCTPECREPLELLQQDWAGDAMLMAAAEAAGAESGNRYLLYKNNTDFFGHSYGCHENYLLPRRLPWDRLARAMQGFLVTRQIFTGAGKYGFEQEDKFVGPGFQISQRADFFSELESVDTMQKRPLVNTRDEPHADPRKWRRFHVILGDANLSPYATWLKASSTALLLQALANGAPDEAFPQLAEPLRALQAISRDARWKWRCRLADGRETTAVEVQRTYLEVVRRYAPPEPGPWLDALEAWAEVLEDLERDPLSCADRLDWAAKRRMIEEFRASEGVGSDDPWLRSLDLAYHRLDRDEGLFYGLLAGGSFRLPAPFEQIAGWGMRPPETTRAAVRGIVAERFGDAILAAQWETLTLQTSAGRLELDLSDLFQPTEAAAAAEVARRARSPDDLRSLPFARPA